MQNSLMVGLTQADMQAVVSTYDLNDFYYPTLFPLRVTHPKIVRGDSPLI